MRKAIFFLVILMGAFYTSKSQQYQWAKRIGNTANDRAHVIKTDASGNVYVAGVFDGLVDFDPGPGIANFQSKGWGDIFVAKYTSNGDYVWAFVMGESSTEDLLDLAIDNENNIIITGAFSDSIDLDPGSANATFYGDFLGNTDGFLAKYSSSGNYIWGFTFGNYNVDYGMDLAINANNDIYLAGYFNETVDFDPGVGNTSLTGQFDAFIAKYDKNSSLQWVFKIGASGQEYTHGITLDTNGNLCVFGRFQQTVDFDPGSGTHNLTASSNHDLFIAKYTSSGSYLWAKQLSGPGSKYGRGISVDADSNIYIGGSFGQNIDFDPSGNTVLSSSTFISPFVAKYNAQGNYIWHHLFLSTTGGSDKVGNVFYSNNYLYVAGNYNGSLNDTLNGNPVSLPSQGQEDIFIAKLNASNGQLVWLGTTGSSDMDIARYIMVSSNNVYICGAFNQTCDFNFDNQVTNNLTSDGAGDIYFAKYSIYGVGIETLSPQAENYSLYPNPNNGNFNIQSQKQNGIYEILDLTGKVIHTFYVQNYTENIQLELPNGLYLIKEKNNNITNKFLINK
jgi:hypothetical protein